VEPLLDSVIKTYYKLQELGIQEVDGKIVFLDELEVKDKINIESHIITSG